MLFSDSDEEATDECPLCNYEQKTPLYFENDFFRVFECQSCHVPIIAFKKHKMSLTQQELYYAHLTIKYLFGKHVMVRINQRKIQDHLHWHLYLTDTKDVNAIYSIPPFESPISGPFSGYNTATSLREAAKCVKIDGDWAEFGVGGGRSTRLIINELLPEGKKLFMFDSFEGLPEDWRLKGDRLYQDYCKGKFDMGGLPPEDLAAEDRGEIYVGLFSDTVPKFRAEYGKRQLAFIHIDCDLYSSTKDVLDNIGDLIGPGTILVFDEFYNYDVDNEGWKQHEYKAFHEFILNSNLDYEYLGRTLQWQVWLRIKGKKTK